MRPSMAITSRVPMMSGCVQTVVPDVWSAVKAMEIVSHVRRAIMSLISIVLTVMRPCLDVWLVLTPQCAYTVQLPSGCTVATDNARIAMAPAQPAALTTTTA